jgi:Core-2/I-Branching enzyme
VSQILFPPLLKIRALFKGYIDMKIAYLILVHDQPQHFKRLVNALNSPDVHFFVHIDLKTDLSEFDCFEHLQNVSFINRIRVHHAGFSQVKTMLNLLREALQIGDFDYFIFLSGKDYPIKSNEFIHCFLKTYYPMNFVDFYALTEQDRVSFKRLTEYNRVDFIGDSPKILQTPLKVIRLLLNKLLPRRRFIKGMSPYRGSAWLCLNQATVEYIFDFLRLPIAKRYVNYFKYAWGTDETFFHTIILNSPHAEQCRHNAEAIQEAMPYLPNSQQSAYLHHIDWSIGRENPAVFDTSDFFTLKESNALFARKFAEKKSKELLDQVDQILLNVSPKSKPRK